MKDSLIGLLPVVAYLAVVVGLVAIFGARVIGILLFALVCLALTGSIRLVVS